MLCNIKSIDGAIKIASQYRLPALAEKMHALKERKHNESVDIQEDAELSYRSPVKQIASVASEVTTRVSEIDSDLNMAITTTPLVQLSQDLEDNLFDDEIAFKTANELPQHEDVRVASEISNSPSEKVEEEVAPAKKVFNPFSQAKKPGTVKIAAISEVFEAIHSASIDSLKAVAPFVQMEQPKKRKQMIISEMFPNEARKKSLAPKETEGRTSCSTAAPAIDMFSHFKSKSENHPIANEVQPSRKGKEAVDPSKSLRVLQEQAQ